MSDQFPILRRLAQRIVDEIGALTDQQLQELFDQASAVTTRNIWWVAYHLAPLVKDLVDSEVTGRQYRAALTKAAKSKGGSGAEISGAGRAVGEPPKKPKGTR